ncbi:TPA: hypothetical protein GRI49_19715 [Vibrio parahaemolyticus]|nr:hypothetical protein [Vibrio parahaemolyticus]OXD12756.1 hypothetical protein CA165_00065 [Vibrio parahaemolyticus]RXP61954.1 hypothetical protein EGL73_00085 [Vibrio parahaemolyticus]RXP63675.1 hypothetical protein EGL72_00070 [Vibrio parahaemolyticus]RXP73813.1 hypothetical protein EGL71_00085 [Vibrio parahaemolyticus]
MWRFSKNNALPNTDNKKSADEKYVGAFILRLLTGIEYQLAKHINHGSC